MKIKAQLAREICVVDNNAGLKIQLKTSPIQISAGHDGRGAVHHDGLGMQQTLLKFMNAHSALQQISEQASACQANPHAVIARRHY